MNYYLYNDTYIACSRVPKSNIEDYQEITQEQYNNYIQSLQTEIEDDYTELIEQLIAQGYTVYK